MQVVFLVALSLVWKADSASLRWGPHIEQLLKRARQGLAREERHSPPGVAFQDFDGDLIQMVLEHGKVNQYVNHQLAHRGLSRFEINPRTRTYVDDSGDGKFMPHEDLHTLSCMIGMLFRSERAVQFQDADGDWIQIVVEDGLVNEYVNGEISLRGLTRFEIDEKTRTYRDDNGEGNFMAGEDLPRLMRLIAILSRTEQAVEFQDIDGDRIRLVIENGKINQYVNRELVHQGLTRFEVDQGARIYYDYGGQGNFKMREDLPRLARLIEVLFQSQSLWFPLNCRAHTYSKQHVDVEPPAPPTVKPESKNLYERLGLTRDASIKAIKKAYRKVAMLWHPDKNPDKYHEAQVMFRNVAEAHDVLSDPSRRRSYDKAGVIL